MPRLRQSSSVSSSSSASSLPHPASAHRPRRAVLVTRAGQRPLAAADASLRELHRLVAGLGFVVADAQVYRTRASEAEVLGAGKLQELNARLVALRGDAAEAPLVVIDEALRPGQLRRLEDALAAEVVDRTDIILRVFERRASTRLSRLEVEIARLSYEAPRVRDVAAVNDRHGGGGRGERGHTGVELRKRRLRARAQTLGREVEGLRRLHQAELQRRSEAPTVALVGYTNAGKSSLMRALTGSEVFVEDQLFATLATTVRALSPATQPRILVTDTVGFIEHLPHELVASFRSTLAEASAADLLIFVVDAADDAWQTQLRVAQETLADIDRSERPALIVCNKIDRVGDERRAALAAALPEALQLSAHDRADVERLRAAIVGFFDDRMVDDVVRVPRAQLRLVGEIRAVARVLGQEHDEDGAWLRVRTLPALLAQVRKRITGEPGPAEPAEVSSAPPEVAAVLDRARRHGLALAMEGATVDPGGLDFQVVTAHDEAGAPYILRVPRRPAVAEAARVEARALRLLAPRLSVAVPRWQIQAPDLIAYPRLPGTPAVVVEAAGPRWNVIDPATPSGPAFEAFVRSYAQLLAGLHTIPLALVHNAELPRRTMAELRAEEAAIFDRVRAALAPPDAVWARWQRWVADDALWPGDGDRTLVHGDLHPAHWLLGEDGTLTGVIDWSEVAFSDPAIDLAFFHGCFGGAGVARLLAALATFETSRPLHARVAEHTAERWAAFPARVADWALRTGDDGALAHARGLLAALP